MKKTILKTAAVLDFLFLRTSVNAQSDNGLIGKAHSATADCLNNYTSHGISIAAGC
jgi:hypothetical protein